MESSEFIGMVMSDAPAADVTDAVKQLLFQKSASMIDDLKPIIGAQMFDPAVEEPEEQDVQTKFKK